MDEILTLKNVSLSYHTETQETKAIDNLTFSVNKGQFIAIIGPSGCGKTTILSLISGLLKPSGGSIFYNGKPVTKPSENIGYMLQKDELFPWLTIYDNVCLPLKIKKIKTKENLEYIDELLDKYGLKDFKKHYPNQLSGGMRQRVALIRTLSFSPGLLLLDEPFSALDYQTRLSVCDDVYDIIRKEGKTAILVTHDISEAISVADKVIVLSKRPTSVFAIHDVTFDNALPPLKRREQRDFSRYFELLWSELNS